MKTLYKQIKIQYKDGTFEMCWIPERFASVGRRILIGKHKGTGNLGTVLEVYAGQLSKEEVQINQEFPLWKVTDI